jgi:hypothetical protein
VAALKRDGFKIWGAGEVKRDANITYGELAHIDRDGHLHLKGNVYLRNNSNVFSHGKAIGGSPGQVTKILTGQITNGKTIPLPGGYTQAQCKWLVSRFKATVSHGDHHGSHSSHCYANSARKIFVSGYGGGTGVAQYMIIGVKDIEPAKGPSGSTGNDGGGEVGATVMPWKSTFKTVPTENLKVSSTGTVEVVKTAGITGTWATAYSKIGFEGGAYLSFTTGPKPLWGMVGLCLTDPSNQATNNTGKTGDHKRHWKAIDYGFYFLNTYPKKGDATWKTFTKGKVDGGGTASANGTKRVMNGGDKCEIWYTGTKLKFYVNGKTVHEKTVGTGKKFYFDSSLVIENSERVGIHLTKLSFENYPPLSELA